MGFTICSRSGVHPLHDCALIGIWWDATVLSQMRSRLLDKVTRLVKADSVSLRILYRLSDTEVVRLPSMAVLSGALELVDNLLFEFGHYYIVSGAHTHRNK